MDIDGIETFLAIARFGSFTGAAQRLHRSQPAISRRLDIVEHKPGAPLFERLRAGDAHHDTNCRNSPPQRLPRRRRQGIADDADARRVRLTRGAPGPKPG